MTNSWETRPIGGNYTFFIMAFPHEHGDPKWSVHVREDGLVMLHRRKKHGYEYVDKFECGSEELERLMQTIRGDFLPKKGGRRSK